MNRSRVTSTGRRDEGVPIKVRGVEKNGVIGVGNKRRVGIGLDVHRHRDQPPFAGRANNASRDLPTIGYQNG